MGSQSPGIRNFMKQKKKKKKQRRGRVRHVQEIFAEEDHKIPIGKEEEIGLKRQ